MLPSPFEHCVRAPGEHQCPDAHTPSAYTIGPAPDLATTPNPTLSRHPGQPCLRGKDEGNERESDVPWDPLAIEIEKLTSEPSRRRTKPSTRPAAMFHSWHRQPVGAIQSSTWRAPHTHTRLPLTHGPHTHAHACATPDRDLGKIPLRPTRGPRLSERGADARSQL